ncbi:protein kinase [Corallococcus sp. BB11-1]|uniref:protein kinase domain-containing protein n=1 Tax=Corallococcus sp. BB11-1 TaxID=2996783 RepID=UPI00226DA361|nr:protein kinase [Corallococcus sp. BB11-1]MCY1032850.1 protein kinase [Corallococcus sp. BB11-1]
MATPVEPEPLKGPLRFGPYTLVRRIGAGGMGEVFLAREEGVRRAVVVKKVLPGLLENRQFVGRFRDEARVVVRLAHPNIARVYAMGEVDGQLFLAMEYVQGKTLSRLAYRLRQRQRMMPLGALLQMGQRLCEGLAYAHDATDEDGHPLHLVHRDLSPANVCVSYAGEVKIIDFGAAQSTLKEQQTAPRVVIGNLTYMAPEQARKRTVDRRADVYAAGVVLWELFAWKPLSQRGDPLERWRRAAYPQWEPAGRHRPDLPRAVDAFLVRALAPEPNDRFPTAAAMAEALAALKEKLTPGVTDQDLVRLMSAAFPREKVHEQQLVEELLREPSERASTRQEFPSVLAPPTALVEREADALRAQEDIATEALDAVKLRQAAAEAEARKDVAPRELKPWEEPGARKAPPVRLHNQEVTRDAWVPGTGAEESTNPAARPPPVTWVPGTGAEESTDPTRPSPVASMPRMEESTDPTRPSPVTSTPRTEEPTDPARPSPVTWTPGSGGEDATSLGVDPRRLAGLADEGALTPGSGENVDPGRTPALAAEATPTPGADSGLSLAPGAEAARLGGGPAWTPGSGADEPTPREVAMPRPSGPGAEDTTDPGEGPRADGGGLPGTQPAEGQLLQADWNPGPEAEDSGSQPRAVHREGAPPAPEDSPMQNRPSRPGWTPGVGSEDSTTNERPMRKSEDTEPSSRAPAKGTASSGWTPGSGEEEATEGAGPSPLALGPDEDADADDEHTAVDKPKRPRANASPERRAPTGRTSVGAAPPVRAAPPVVEDFPDATRPLSQEELPVPWTPGGAGEATEALEAAKIFGALSRTTGNLPAYLSEQSAPYVAPKEAPRRAAPVVDERPNDTRPIPVRTKTRETLVGYDMDISAALKVAEELKARERELAEAKRKGGKKPAKVVHFQLPRLPWPLPSRYRFWAMLAVVVVVALVLGFGVMWLFVGSSGGE